MSSVAIGLQPLEYFIHNDFDALRIEMAGNLSGLEAQSAYEDSITALRLSHHRQLIVDITYVDKADETGRAVLRAWRRLKTRIVAASPFSRAIAEPIVNVETPAAGNSAFDERASRASAPEPQNRAEKTQFADSPQMECELP